MKVVSVVGLRGALVLCSVGALLLGGGCGSDDSSTPPPAEKSCADEGCDLGYCLESSGKCVECLEDEHCDSAETCVQSRCVEKDTETVCTPGAAHCSLDRGSVITCAADGSKETREACAADAPCTTQAGTARCADWICSPNTFSCDGNTLTLCSDDGTSQLPFQTCQADQYCDARRALCIERVCTPGEKSCDGASLQICNDDGSDLLEEDLCSLSEACSPDGCEPLICIPNATFCHEGDVWQCSDTATSSSLLTSCAGAEKYCQEREGEAVCSDQVCFPDDPMCNDGAATLCKSDGSGPKPGGEKCADHGQVCFAGSCRDQVCTPGQKLCKDDDVYLCADNGSDATIYANCQADQYCDAATGSCRYLQCIPGAPGCFGTIKAVCKDDGSGYAAGAVDCADDGEVCDSGSCVPKVCEPNTRVCVDGGTAWCNYAGSAISTPQPCWSGTHCSAGNCVSNVCVAGQPACDGNKVSVCRADGSGAVPGDSANDCTAQAKVCEDGQCKPKLCEPGSQLCSGGNIQRCSATGASFTLLQYCLSETYCKALTPTTAECRPKLCVSGATGCIGEHYGTCAGNGVDLQPGFDDCDSAAQVCTLAGCAPAAIDDLGGTTEIVSLASGSMIFDRIKVTTPRKLGEIAAYLSLPSNRSLRWVVYQTQANPYEWVLAFDKVTTSSGAQYHSSGAISFALQLEREYLVGVVATGGSYAAYTEPVSGTQPLSFGHAYNAGTASFSTPLGYYYNSTGALSAFRLTTTLPD